ncbi:MAG: UDP-N-acetylmuramate dehydrogenase [Syntrophobacteraceae bacterium]
MDRWSIQCMGKVMHAKLSALEAIPDVELRKDEPLARHTTFRVGGPVRFLARPRSREALVALLNALRQCELPFIIVGEGSNVLAPDEPWDMVVIQLHLACNGLVCAGPNARGLEAVFAGAGTTLWDLMSYCVSRGLQGLECLAGVPATVGGALFMNASTSWGSICDHLAYIDVLDAKGNKRTLCRQALSPGYRTMSLPQNCVILGAGFELGSCVPDLVKERVETILEKRRRTQPLRYPSAGSVFKNPEGQFAGALVEKAGLKGYRIGDAQISEKHANWIVNRGRATAGEIIELVEKAENEVYGTFGVRLEREIRILGQLYRSPALC